MHIQIVFNKKQSYDSADLQFYNCKVFFGLEKIKS